MPERDHAISAWGPGQVIADKYELIEAIGAGGMGVVYAARRLSLADVVAIKTIHPERIHPRNRARFVREARAMARIRHPRVVQVFDFGETADGQPFMVMEFIEGPTLAQVLHDRAETGAGPIPLEQALPLFVDVCKAVEAGHRRGVVHRDLKPGNIMLGRSDDGTESVKVLDFGLASLVDEDEDDPERSSAHALVGTVAYMSPESIEQGAASPASDLFALGVMLYEMVTGEQPFSGHNPIATIMAVCEGVYRSPRELVPDLPPAVEQAIAAALRRNPSERPGSALELAGLARGARVTTSPLTAGLDARLEARGRRTATSSDAAGPPTIQLQVGPTKAAPGSPTLELERPWDVDSPVRQGTTSGHSVALERGADDTIGPDDGDADLLGDSQESQRDSLRVRAALAAPPFVGRKLELDTLVEILASVTRDQAAFALVHAEPGMGRTRLLRRFAQLAADRDALVLEGRFLAYEGDRATARQTFLRMLGPELADDPAAALEDHAQLAARLEDRAGGRPLVLLLDDLHSAPVHDLEFLTYVVRGGRRSVPIMIVASARSDAARSDARTELSTWLLRLARVETHTSLALSPFGEAELRAWLEATFGRLRIHPRDLRALERACDGNPYYLSELIRHLVVRERLHPSPVQDDAQSEVHGGWVCEALDRDVLPEGVRAAVRAQLDNLSPELRALLETAAVIGEHLDLEVLARASGLPEAELDARLDEAVASSLLSEEPPESGVDLRFRSNLVPQVLYEGLGGRRRKRLHTAVVEALADLGRGQRDARRLAWHYRAIARWPETLAHGLYSARQALDHHDHDAAEFALEHAGVALARLEALDHPDAPLALARVRFSTLAGKLDGRVGRFEQGASRLREARALLDRAAAKTEPAHASFAASLIFSEADTRALSFLRFELALTLAHCQLGLGRLEQAADAGREALALAADLDVGLDVGLDIDIGLGRHPEPSSGDLRRLEAEWDARVALGHILGRFGAWDEATEVLAPVTAADPLPRLRGLHVNALREQGWLAARRGAVTEADAIAATARAEARACREPFAEYCAASVSAVALAARADPAGALPHYREALRLARALSLRRREMIEQANASLALVELGRYDEALRNMLSVRALCRELGDVASAADARVGLGRILRAGGNLDEAILSFRQGFEACEAVGRHEYASIALLELGNSHLERQEWAAAREVLTQAQARFAAMGSVNEWEVELGLARAARGFGEIEAARGLALQARARLEAQRSSVDAALRDRVDRPLARVHALLTALEQVATPP